MNESLVKVSTKNEKKWLKSREGVITSTEVEALMGVNKYGTRLTLFHTKHPQGNGLEMEEFETTERMRAGKKLEPAIVRWAAEQFGWKAKKQYDFLMDPELRLGASYDYNMEKGSVDNVNVSGWGLEVKMVDYLIWRDEWKMEDNKVEPPTHIQLQGHTQRVLDDKPGTVFLVCVGGNKLEVLLQPRRPYVESVIVSEVEKFWDLKEAPEPNYLVDAELVRKLYPNGDKSQILDARGDDYEPTRVIRELAEEHYRCAQIVKRHEARKKEMVARMLSELGTYGKVLLPDGGSIACGEVAGSPPQVITEDMVGQSFGGRKGYRMCRVTPPKHLKQELAGGQS